MVVQNRIETYCLNEDDYILYRVTNNDTPCGLIDGQSTNPGLKITLCNLSYDRWVTQIWPTVGVEWINGDNDSLSDDAIRELVFSLLQGESKKIAGWKIISVEFWTDGTLDLVLRNPQIEEWADFLEERSRALGKQDGTAPALAEVTPGDHFVVRFHAKEEQRLRFEIAPSSADNCAYELVLKQEAFWATEKSQNHYRSIAFGQSIEENGRTIYRAEVREAFLH